MGGPFRLSIDQQDVTDAFYPLPARDGRRGMVGNGGDSYVLFSSPGVWLLFSSSSAASPKSEHLNNAMKIIEQRSQWANPAAEKTAENHREAEQHQCGPKRGNDLACAEHGCRAE